jgi:hypothetical protein
LSEKPKKSDYLILAPFTFYGRTFYIGSDFYPGLANPGKYKIKAEYRNIHDNGTDFGLDVWTGRIFSNEVVIEILE